MRDFHYRNKYQAGKMYIEKVINATGRTERVYKSINLKVLEMRQGVAEVLERMRAEGIQVWRSVHLEVGMGSRILEENSARGGYKIGIWVEATDVWRNKISAASQNGLLCEGKKKREERRQCICGIWWVVQSSVTEGSPRRRRLPANGVRGVPCLTIELALGSDML